MHSFRGCWDRTQDCCDFGIGSQSVALITRLVLIHSWLDLVRYSRVVTNSEISFAAITGSLNPSLIMVATCRQVLHVDKVIPVVNCSKMAFFLQPYREDADFEAGTTLFTVERYATCTIYILTARKHSYNRKSLCQHGSGWPHLQGSTW